MNTLRSGVLAAPLLVYAPFLVKTCPIRSHAQLNCWPHNWLRCPENNVPRPRADDHSQQKLEPYRLPNYIHRQVKHKEEIDQNFKSFFSFVQVTRNVSCWGRAWRHDILITDGMVRCSQLNQRTNYESNLGINAKCETWLELTSTKQDENVLMEAEVTCV